MVTRLVSESKAIVHATVGEQGRKEKAKFPTGDNLQKQMGIVGLVAVK